MQTSVDTAQFQYQNKSIAHDTIQGWIQGGHGGQQTSFRNHNRKAKIMLLCTLNALFLEFSIISILFEMKPPIPYMGLHPPRPLLQFTPLKFEIL